MVVGGNPHYFCAGMSMGKKLHILILEDVAADAELMERELRKGGVDFTARRVDSREGFAQGLDLFSPDLILADFKLPAFDGLAALEMAMVTRPLTPFIFVSGAIGEESAIDILKRGGTDFVRKDNLPRLIPSLQRALREAEERQERRRIEEALAESEQRYRSLFEESKDMIAMVTPEGRLLDINPAGMELFGYVSKEDALSMNVSSEIYADASCRKKLQETIAAEGFAKDFEAVMRKKNGELLDVLITAVPVRGENGGIRAHRAIIRDVTEKKRLEEQLIHAQKMEAVGLLAGGVAHDFNNILTAIIGYAEIMKMRLEKDSPLAGSLDHILAASDRAAALTASLLAFNREQVINLHQVDMNEVVQIMEKLLSGITGEEIEIKAYLEAKEPTVMADSGQMLQVLMDITANARDAMPDGGVLTIRTDIVAAGEGRPCLPEESASNGCVRVSIADTGAGMDSETLGRVFEPFFTTKEFGKGRGLGLSIAYGIIKQHRGWLNIQSEPGSGTVVEIYLPLAAPGAASGASSSAHSDLNDGGHAQKTGFPPGVAEKGEKGACDGCK